MRVAVSDDGVEETLAATESSPLLDSGLHEKHGTVFSSVFTLISTMVGGGILSLPFAFQQGGYILTSVALFIVLMASTHGGFLIVNSKKYCQGRIKNVEDVAKIAYGDKGKVMYTDHFPHSSQSFRPSVLTSLTQTTYNTASYITA